MATIKLKIKGNSACYVSETRTITWKNSAGVSISSDIPANWGLVRVFKFMESLLNPKK